MRGTWIILGGLLTLAAGCAGPGGQTGDEIAAAAPEPALASHLERTREAAAADFATQPTEPADRPRQQEAVSPTGRWVAYSVSEPDRWPPERLLVSDRETEETFEITGLPAGRPFGELRWAGEGKLAFTRWPGAHEGLRYVVDVEARELAELTPFADDWLKRQHQPTEAEAE
ncbi:MAG: hypothetical protein ACLFVN_07120 [Phycisphaeraceae bacterium]